MESTTRKTLKTKDILMRPATQADRDGILDIYRDETDYLPNYIDTYLSNHSIPCYVACAYGEIVGFLSERRLDGGATAVPTAGRVKPEVQGQGVYRLLYDHIEATTSAKALVFTVVEGNSVLTRPSFLKEHTRILTWTKSMYDLRVNPDYETATDNNKFNIRKVDPDTMRALFESPALMSYLFPEKKMFITYMPHSTTMENLSQLKWNESTFYTDVSLTSSGEASGLLSVSTLMNGNEIVMEIYGSNPKSLCVHLQTHLNEAYVKAMHTNDTITQLSVNSSFSKEVIDEAMKRHGRFISETPKDRPSVKWHLFEKEVYQKCNSL